MGIVLQSLLKHTFTLTSPIIYRHKLGKFYVKTSLIISKMGILSSDVKEVKIVLDPKQGRSFFPGEVMKGKVILVTEKDDIKLQKLTMTFTGESIMKWKDVSWT